MAGRYGRCKYTTAVVASQIFVDARKDSDADVIVLTGAGRAFSAGGDIDWMQRSIDSPSDFEETAREAKDIVFSQLQLDKPVIARINGHAIGLGASLALLCNVIVMADTAKIDDPHVSVGLVAGDGGALIWPQIVGYAKARHYRFTRELLTAQEAERIGLVTQVVPAAELDARVQELAGCPASGPLKALFHAHFDAGVAYECLSNLTDDHQEAVHAFRERRKPAFRGT